jgi:glyoxalase family protein
VRRVVAVVPDVATLAQLPDSLKIDGTRGARERRAGMAETGKAFGIHHVTAIAGDPARNLDFYSRVLGLRLVKRTVNFDDPGTYHLYFGDRAGSPGTILTFFPYPGARPGRHGTGQAVEITFAVRRHAFAVWLDRLHRLQIAYEGPETRMGESILRFRDPDGLTLEIAGIDGLAETGAAVWTTDEVGAETALHGFHGVTLWQRDHEATADILTGHLGYERTGEAGDRVRFAVPGEGPGRIVDLRRMPDSRGGTAGAGTVHHVAFRASGAEQQHAVQEAVRARGLNVTPVIDRNYFHSIYFREPGGVLFEVATDPPGFTVDEPAESLGTSLKLPAQHEARRAEIEAALPTL